jgi:dTDP-4-amino-4,6-dideoxygalactose transaminase
MQETLVSYDKLYAFGRDAIFWGLRTLDPQPGDCIWVPSFHCGVEVQAALDAGFDVDFYRVRLDLSVDEDDLNQKLSARPGPVMVIHYFGFPQPGLNRLAELCQHLGVALVEDCCHALFSSFASRPVGQFGQVAAFSLYKTLGLCDGGALLLSRRKDGAASEKAPVAPPEGAPSLYGYKIQARALLKNALGVRLTRWYRRLRPGVWESRPIRRAESHGPSHHPIAARRHNYRRRMSALSRRLASTMDPDQIVQKRRDNWRSLHNRLILLPGYCTVFDVLQEGVCPLYLPLWVSKRETLSSKLMSCGIETFVFGRFAHPLMNKALFPQAEAMRRHILGFPLHQYMNEAQLTRLIEAVGPLLGGHDIRAETMVKPEDQTRVLTRRM